MSPLARRKLRPADRVRPPCYVDRETGAAELCITTETWDAMVLTGELPPATVTFSIGHRWRWLDVIEWREFGPPANEEDQPPPPGPYIHEGIVYLVGFGPYVKIGWTKDHTPHGRMYDLQTGCPETLECFGAVPGSRDLERALHGRFAAYSTRGEWFRREGDLATWIESGCPL